MNSKTSWKEQFIYHSVDLFGRMIRCLPLATALFIGRAIGLLAYHFDIRHQRTAYANIRMAFADGKHPDEIRRIIKDLFMSYGQNFIDLLRMPLITPERFKEMITVEGEENLAECLKQGKGAIMLAMHFGSWELASLSCAMLGLPYKVIVKPQKKYSRLEELLNSYRSCGGYVTISKGMGTRDLVRSLQNNEVIGMVVDQGGKDGVLVPFFGRRASMSVGAIRMGLKWKIPICFSVIHRDGPGHHRMIIHKPLQLIDTGNINTDLGANLSRVTKFMEEYICRFPCEYMWFYKIWKYSDETNITIVSDDKMGHLRQAQAVAERLKTALSEKGVSARSRVVSVVFKTKWRRKFFSLISLLLASPVFNIWIWKIFQWSLTEESFAQIIKDKSDFVVSCGSSVAGAADFLARDHQAKSIVILKPGPLGYGRFNLVILPQHESPGKARRSERILLTQAAPNLISPQYQDEQAALLLTQYSHLKNNLRVKIGLLLGGNSKDVFVSEDQIKVLIHQMTEVAHGIKADILVTTSRRTPPAIEQLLYKRLKKHPNCPLLIIENHESVSAAVGGIMGISDILVVSGDSISMISEAASSGKNTIVFTPEIRPGTFRKFNKHQQFIEKLNAQGFILSVDAQNIGRTIYDVAKNKIQTKKLDDNQKILEALRKIA